MLTEEQIDNIFEIVTNVRNLSDEDLVKEFSLAPPMESGEVDDYSRLWTKALQIEVFSRGMHEQMDSFSKGMDDSE